MKIGFVIDDTLDSTDGVQQYVLTVGKWMSNQGHEVHYIAGQTARKDINNIHSLSKNIKVTFNKNRLSVPLSASKSAIRKVLNSENFDVLHVQVPYSPLMSGKVINNSSEHTAIIGTFHILPFSKKEILATKLLSRVVKKTNNKFMKFIAVSAPAQEFAKSAFGINSVVIPNPVKLTSVTDKRMQAKTKIIEMVYLGRLVQRKGPVQLLKAFSYMRSKLNVGNVNLTLYGEGPLKGELKNLTTYFNLEDRVNLAGFLDEKDKTHVLSKADIAVFPSIGGESFGIVLTEAMAAGAGVVLGGDNPGYRSVLEDSTTLFNPNNTEAFARCLARYVGDPKLIRTTHNNQAKLLSKFDIDIVGPQIEKLYVSEIAKLNNNTDNT